MRNSDAVIDLNMPGLLGLTSNPIRIYRDLVFSCLNGGTVNIGTIIRGNDLGRRM